MGVYENFFFTILNDVEKYAILSKKVLFFYFYILLGRSELWRDFLKFQIT